jgi:hypothetical protein
VSRPLPPFSGLSFHIHSVGKMSRTRGFLSLITVEAGTSVHFGHPTGIG